MAGDATDNVDLMLDETELADPNAPAAEPNEPEDIPGDGFDLESLYDEGDPGEADDADAKDEGEEKPEPKDETKAEDKRQWDRDRQKRDQQAANQRKTLEARLEAQAREIEALKAQVSGRREAGKASEQGEDTLPELTEDSTADELVKAIRQRDTLIRGLGEKLERLESGLKEVDERHEEERIKAQASERFRTRVGELTKEYGKDLEAQATAATREYFRKAGYYGDEGRRPSMEQVLARMETEFLKARTASAEKAKQDRQRRQKASRNLDRDGGGRGKASMAASSGDIRSVMTAMKHEGKL